jgi:hypothetical protein
MHYPVWCQTEDEHNPTTVVPGCQFRKMANIGELTASVCWEGKKKNRNDEKGCRDRNRSDSPRGTCQIPPLWTVNSFSWTLTSTTPDWTLKTMCIFLEFLVRFIWSARISMSPQLRNPPGPTDPILAYWKEPSATSSGLMPFSAQAIASGR